MNELFKNIRQDVSANASCEMPSIRQFLKLFLRQPGFRCVVSFRIMDFVYRKRVKYVPHILRGRILRLYGTDFGIGAVIGGGLQIYHPVGIVIGSEVVLGSNCIVRQGVTVGMRFGTSDDGKSPIIGSGCTLGANAVVLGGIKLGDNVTVGAGSVVLHNFEAGSIVVGAPARLLVRPKPPRVRGG